MSGATSWAYHRGWAVAARVPEPLVGPTVTTIADAVWARRGTGIRMLETNLARVVPDAEAEELRALSRQGMRSYMRYWSEVIRLPRWSPERVRAGVVTHHIERLRDPLAARRGVVAALPHMGNWDLAGAWAGADGMPVTTVVERLRPEGRYESFVRLRERLGMEVLPLGRGASTMRLLERRLRTGRLVCLLADRDLSGRGARVPLVGAMARIPLGPAWLARATGALLLPVSTFYDPQRMHLVAHEPVEVAAGHRGLVDATAAVAEAFTVAIRRSPADWHMLQPVFEPDLARRR
ncbi:MAG: phosphatidylinositol mannoside acyltransferase [Nocardioidaceae bacterium]|nr:phosphatidylinositol mannoside acyltransferase [Nocardioidaceae bacterium]